MIGQLFALLSGDLEPIQQAAILMQLAARLFVIVFCVSVHEFAHALAAKKLGDNTAFMRGRLTLNPAKHLDLIGTAMILIVGFGYAKPVPVNPGHLQNIQFKKKRVKKGMAIVAAAGPASNLAMALIFHVIRSLVPFLALAGVDHMHIAMISFFFYWVVYSNIALAIFNLLPIPPLDGSRILDLFLPIRASMWMHRNERYFMYGIMGLFLLVFFVGRLF